MRKTTIVRWTAAVLFVAVPAVAGVSVQLAKRTQPAATHATAAAEKLPGPPVAATQAVAIRDDGSFKKSESFEGGQIPAAWQTDGGGQLSLSAAHYKHGRQSLQWNWAQGSRLLVIKPPNLEQAGASKRGGIKLWLYNEKAVDGKATFRLGSEQEINSNNPRYVFEIGINFTGWRGMWIQFREDGAYDGYKGDGKAPLEVMEIIPPAAAPQGSLFFDVVEFEGTIPATRSTDYQVPYDRKRSNDGMGGTWDRSYYWSQMKPDLPLADRITPEQSRAFETIAKRYEGWIYGEHPDLTREPLRIRNSALQSFIAKGLQKYAQLGLNRDGNGYITGPPLFSSRSTHGPEFGEDVAKTIFLPLVFDYKINGRQESKNKVLDLFDYFHDQGWADGSGLETLDHETNRTNGYFHAVYLMRKELQESGRLDRELATVRWFTNFGKTYIADPGETTADEIRTKFMYELLYVLALDDGPAKVREMQSLLRWMNHALAVATGFAGTIKDDFMGFHHRGVYMSAYARQAFHMAALIAYLLHDTPFALSKQSTDNMPKRAADFSDGGEQIRRAGGLSGRFPAKDGVANEIVPAYAYMALASEPVDREMAGAFMRLWDPSSPYLKQGLFPKADSGDVSYLDTIGGLQLALKLADQGFAPEKSPQFWMKPSAAFAVMRRDDWAVSVKGWSQYVFDFESQAPKAADSAQKALAGQNVFGRYASYGAMQVMAAGDPINKANNGYGLDNGWDWNRWPGATTIRLPWERLGVSKDRPQTRSFTDQTFVGGVESEGKDGIFAMKLHDTVYDKSFRAEKSVFFLDNEVIALGSGIHNDDGAHSTETTLFQSYMKDTGMPIRTGSAGSAETIAEFPYRRDFKPKENVWLMDPYGNDISYRCGGCALNEASSRRPIRAVKKRRPAATAPPGSITARSRRVRATNMRCSCRLLPSRCGNTRSRRAMRCFEKTARLISSDMRRSARSDTSFSMRRRKCRAASSGKQAGRRSLWKNKRRTESFSASPIRICACPSFPTKEWTTASADAWNGGDGAGRAERKLAAGTAASGRHPSDG
uniref:Heparinase n=1 Tax=Niallia circulans TaxID=1397 RepID=Q8KKH9_NIACI|nr:heparinase [Niallia circulans]